MVYSEKTNMKNDMELIETIKEQLGYRTNNDIARGKPNNAWKHLRTIIKIHIKLYTEELGDAGHTNVTLSRTRRMREKLLVLLNVMFHDEKEPIVYVSDEHHIMFFNLVSENITKNL